MSENSADEAVALLEEIGRLMQLRGENVFKIRAYEKAAGAIAGKTDLVERARAGTLTELQGIGKGIAETLTEFLLHGTSRARDGLSAGLPAGLAELTAVPGVGPKKAIVLIEKLGVHSIAELEYACKENRLLKLPGFGEKLQHKILEGIQFARANAGQLRIDAAFPQAEAFVKALTEAAEGRRVSETGALRRRMETLSALDFLIELPDDGADGARARAEAAAKAVFSRLSGALPYHLHFASARGFGYELARTTAAEGHWRALGEPRARPASTEEDFYASIEAPWTPPETRESGEELGLARAGALKKLLPWNGVKGIFHNHTTRSDGVATLEQMVVAAKKLGYSYIGVSDHSQSAFYAQGLRTDALLEQEREIRHVQERHPDIRVFWGIESDILADGALDYEPSVLKRFDFVIASVHSRFQMDRETMTNRILEAIRNPCTRFLGHATGRLLLGRKGYEVDMEKIIQEAAGHGVAIEINANPARLDIDWRWGSELRKRGTFVSVNPDAHDVDGLEDVKYGVAMARKALMPADLVLNSKSSSEVERWLKRA